MSEMRWVPRKQIHDIVYVDHRNEVSIVGTVPEAYGEEIIALGGYYLDQHTNRAEVAFIVGDRWQGRGIGTFMLSYLISIAKRHGIAGFTAEVLWENRAMQAVLRKSDCKLTSRLSEGVYSYTLEFA